MSLRAREILEAQDKNGPPYVIPWSRDTGTYGVDYGMAVEIALSRHPSRVLANTNAYRYGRFTFAGDGTVQVHMLDSHIATFRPAAVQLWSRGWATVTTSEALSALVTGGYFYTHNGTLNFCRYSGGGTTADRTTPFAEGGTFPYVRGETL